MRAETAVRYMRQIAGSIRIRAVFISALISLLAAFLLFCASCGGPGGQPVQDSPLDAGLQRRIEEQVEEVMADNGIPGAIVAVEIPGEGSWVAALGLSDVEGDGPMDTSLLFRIGSISKTFTATAVLQLVDEGRLGLDTTLVELGTQPAVPGGNEISVRRLLNHTSGLFDYTKDRSFQEAQGEDLLRKWSPGEMVAIAAAHDLEFPPGQGWSYSNTNYILLGMIVEGVTGNSFDEEISKRFTRPLGLSNTFLPDGPGIEGEHSRGYAFAADLLEDPAGDPDELLEITTAIDPSWSWAAGGMISNLEDLRVWARALAEGDLLSEEVQIERLQTVEAWQGSRYGLGIADYEGFLGHPGDIPGFSSAMFYDPESGTSVIMTLNKNPNDLGFASYVTFTEIADIILE
jgi:D-alanyl-D-alanine carboxypeptidase